MYSRDHGSCCVEPSVLASAAGPGGPPGHEATRPDKCQVVRWPADVQVFIFWNRELLSERQLVKAANGVVGLHPGANRHWLIARR
jgi:hypothetical protein